MWRAFLFLQRLVWANTMLLELLTLTFETVLGLFGLYGIINAVFHLLSRSERLLQQFADKLSACHLVTMLASWCSTFFSLGVCCIFVA
ncbi:hypothetical protein F5146DRAFT_1064032 [Armillaria mellea]|nr:hypothetical protein F5146DRAFT_1064032 [Armillaria mellea]